MALEKQFYKGIPQTKVSVGVAERSKFDLYGTEFGKYWLFYLQKDGAAKILERMAGWPSQPTTSSGQHQLEVRLGFAKLMNAFALAQLFAPDIQEVRLFGGLSSQLELGGIGLFGSENGARKALEILRPLTEKQKGVTNISPPSLTQNGSEIKLLFTAEVDSLAQRTHEEANKSIETSKKNWQTYSLLVKAKNNYKLEGLSLDGDDWKWLEKPKVEDRTIAMARLFFQKTNLLSKLKYQNLPSRFSYCLKGSV